MTCVFGTFPDSVAMAPDNSTPVLERTIQVTSDAKKAKSSLLWGCLNCAVFSVLLVDMWVHLSSYACFHLPSIRHLNWIFFFISLFYLLMYYETILSFQHLHMSTLQSLHSCRRSCCGRDFPLKCFVSLWALRLDSFWHWTHHLDSTPAETFWCERKW